MSRAGFMSFNCLVLKVEVCSGSLVDVLQSVVSGSEGCLFSYGHAGLGRCIFHAVRKRTRLVPCNSYHMILFIILLFSWYLFLSFFQVKQTLWLAETKKSKLWD